MTVFVVWPTPQAFGGVEARALLGGMGGIGGGYNAGSGVGCFCDFDSRKWPVFQELVPKRQMYRQERGKIGLAWVGRPAAPRDLGRMLDGEGGSAHLLKAHVFKGGNDEVLLVEFGSAQPLTDVEIEFSVSPLNKDARVEQMLLLAPRMWSVECYDESLEDAKRLERVGLGEHNGGVNAFPDQWQQATLLLAPWEASAF